jgi:hypothetical protein
MGLRQLAVQALGPALFDAVYSAMRQRGGQVRSAMCTPRRQGSALLLYFTHRWVSHILQVIIGRFIGNWQVFHR